ncbi:MAG: hypothetical protein KDA54_10285 [Phycisphaerales bacterium]|nr:hypothetical protein [Phycisphaerales bacterium]
MSLNRSIYDHAPVFLQNIMCTLAGAVRNRQRYDRQSAVRRKFFRDSIAWTLEEAESYQLSRLKELASHAYKNVPYYKQVFDSTELIPGDIQSLSDWQKLPMLSKDDVRQAGVSLVSRNDDPQKLVKSRSGGSTGMPLTCYHSRDSLHFETASGRFFSQYVSSWIEEFQTGGVRVLFRKFRSLRYYHLQLIGMAMRQYVSRLRIRKAK